MTLTRREVIQGCAFTLGASSIGILTVPRRALAQSPPAGTAIVLPSGDATGSADRSAIQNAINNLEAAGGGTVQLVAGNYYLDSRLTISNRLSIVGANGRPTEIKPGSAFNDQYLFEFHNRAWNANTQSWDSLAQFNCRLENLSIKCLGNASLVAAVWGRSWNEQCGLRNVLIWDYVKHAVLFTDGFGGTATFELRECEFMSAGNASASYPGLFFWTTSTVGYANAILEHVVVSGPSSPTGYTCIEARNGLNVIITGGHVEQCEYGIYMTNRSNLTLSGFTGSPTGVVNLIGCASDFSGKVFGSAVLKAGATGYVLRDNKLGNHISTGQNPLIFP